MDTKTCIIYNKIVYKSDDCYIVEMLPNDRHKSFWGKAHALFTPFYSALFSYKTPIMVHHAERLIDGIPFTRLYEGGHEIIRHYSGMDITGWIDTVSPTTLRHIKAFCGMYKKEFMNLPFDLETARAWYDRIDADTNGWRYK